MVSPDRLVRSLSLGCLLVAGGCLASTDALDAVSWRCDDDDDCGSGYRCSLVEHICERAYAGLFGVSKGEIKFGMSAALDPSSDGALARIGIEAYFARVNRTGGLHGRRLRLDARNDQNDAASTRRNV